MSYDYGIYDAFSLIKGNISDDITVPIKNKIISCLYKIMNFFMNIVSGIFKK